MGYVPELRLLLTVMVMVELPLPGAGIVCGLKFTVMPAGMPEAEKVMSPLKPLFAIVVRVEIPCVPCTMLSEVGEAESVKFGCPGRHREGHRGVLLDASAGAIDGDWEGSHRGPDPAL